MLRILGLALSTAAVIAAGPGDPDFYNTVAEIFSGPDCNNETFVWEDPIFGRGGRCQPLDRHDNTPDILSYKPTTIYPNCLVNLYTDSECDGAPYSAEVDQCVQAGVPFISAFVECPFSGVS